MRAKTATTPKAEANKNRPFTAANVGMSAKGPFAFHLEGFVTRDPNLMPPVEGKKQMVTTSIGISGNAWAVLARAEGTYSKETEYPENEFVDLVVFGKTAEEFSKAVTKGSKVAVSGHIQRRDYTKDGETRESVSVVVDGFVVLATKKQTGELRANMVPATAITTAEDGKETTTPTACLVNGTVVGLKTLGTGKSGKSYLQFGLRTQVPAEKIYDLAVGQWSKDKSYDDKKTIVNMTVFGATADRMAKLLKPGMEMAVTGRIEKQEYNGNISYQMMPFTLSVMKFVEAAEAANDEASTSAPAKAPKTPKAAPATPPADDDDDDELPF